MGKAYFLHEMVPFYRGLSAITASNRNKLLGDFFGGIRIGQSLTCQGHYKESHFFENKIEIAGGIVLIGIGVKILIEQLTAVL